MTAAASRREEKSHQVGRLGRRGYGLEREVGSGCRVPPPSPNPGSWGWHAGACLSPMGDPKVEWSGGGDPHLTAADDIAGELFSPDVEGALVLEGQ